MTMNKRGRQWQEQCSFALWTAAFQEVDLDASERRPHPKAKRRRRSILRCGEWAEQKEKALSVCSRQTQTSQALLSSMTRPKQKSVTSAASEDLFCGPERVSCAVRLYPDDL
jgi:hypothetical protein